MDDALPQSVEAEEEFDFLATDDLADRFHGALAAGALKWVAAPDFQDEIAPEGAHVAGGLLGRCGDEEDFGLKICIINSASPNHLGVILLGAMRVELVQLLAMFESIIS